MASAAQNDRPHRSSGIPREQRERERAERHAQRASAAAAAAAAAGGQNTGVAPPSPALIRSNSRGKSGARDGRQSDLPSASNVAIVAGRQPNNTSSAQPQPKRASSNQPSGVATPGIYPYQQNPYAQHPPSGSYGPNGTQDAYDSRNQSLANGQNGLGGPEAVGSPRPVMGEEDRQQRANGEYMDQEEDPNQRKGGFAKFMEILTCRCA